MQLRQGDIFIEQVSEIPSEAEKEPINSEIILARGEATGHAHVIRRHEHVEVFHDNGHRYIRVKRKVEITHEEHNSIPLPEGDYRIIHQREYQPDAPRYVGD